MSGRPDRATGTVREWLRYAEEDLGVAERESARGTGAYHTICFLVAGRYPGDLALEGIGEAEAREALQAVRRIRDRVREELL